MHAKVSRPLLEGKDWEHIKLAKPLIADELDLVEEALALLEKALAAVHQRLGGRANVSSLSAVLLLARAYHQLRAAATLLLRGYYSEVYATIRGVYESGNLARYLALNPAKAEEWFSKGKWIRDAEVRKETPLPDAFDKVYRELSSRTHPTVLSTAPLTALGLDQSVTVRREGLWDENLLGNEAVNLAIAGLWVVLVARNCFSEHLQHLSDWHNRVKRLEAAAYATATEGEQRQSEGGTQQE